MSSILHEYVGVCIGLWCWENTFICYRVYNFIVFKTNDIRSSISIYISHKSGIRILTWVKLLTEFWVYSCFTSSKMRSVRNITRLVHFSYSKSYNLYLSRRSKYNDSNSIVIIILIYFYKGSYVIILIIMIIDLITWKYFLQTGGINHN